MKQFIAISGSPRKGGTTDTLLNVIVEEIKKSGLQPEIVRICSLNILPCNECRACDVTGECNITDGMHYFYDAFRKADAILIVSPIFFSSLPAQVKAFVDRFQSWWAAREKLGKKMRKKLGKIAFIAVGGRNSEKDFECARRPLRALSIIAELEWVGDVYFPEIDEPSDLPPKKVIINKVKQLIDNLLS